MFKIIGITVSSHLRKPCWITGKSLSPKSRKCPVLEHNHIYKKLYCVKSYIIIIYYYCWFLSLIFRFLLLTTFLSSVIPTPWTHIMWDVLSSYFNLVLLTILSWGYVQVLELLISAGCRCYGNLVFFQHTSWCSCLLFQLHLWWLVWPLPSCSIIFWHSIWRSTYLLIFSLWPSSGCCSHLEWPHLWFGTYQTSSPVWLCLVCCRGHVRQWWLGSPTGYLPSHSPSLIQDYVDTSNLLPLWCHSTCICPGAAGQLLGCAC